jgi:polysaccharide deacetylase family protein (PEP-CTERM system associated)
VQGIVKGIVHMNIFQVDVEHFYCDYHVDVKRWENVNEWQEYRERTVRSTEKLLQLFEKNKVTATFFILGCVAKEFPDLVEKIETAGHEIASHGYWHNLVTRQTPKEFEDDLRESLKVLNGLSHSKVIGYRACNNTLEERTSWMIDILTRYGLKYDSSIFPFRTYYYGVKDAPLFPYHISSHDIKVDSPMEDFLEFPLSVYKVPVLNVNVPIAGGFYFRFFPYPFIKHSLKKLNKVHKPGICYVHNWEVDPAQPRIELLRGKLYHYWGLSRNEQKLNKLLSDFSFVSTREWIETSRY